MTLGEFLGTLGYKERVYVQLYRGGSDYDSFDTLASNSELLKPVLNKKVTEWMPEGSSTLTVRIDWEGMFDETK